MGKHAILSPSAAERWLECPASIRMEALVPPQAESSYATEGTAAHELGEIKASFAFGMITKQQYTHRRNSWRKQFSIDDITEIEMEEHTDAYVELLQERVALYPHSQLMLEQRLDTGVPSSFGTSDAVIVSPIHVEIVDFKYGQGVAVEAKGNPQLRLYALGALDTYGDLLGETELVRITVHQPRMDHVLTDEMTPEALREWRVAILPIAAEALTDDARFGPSDEACRWCPASGRCKAQLEAVFAEDFDQKPDLLTPEEMAGVIGRIPLVKEWLKAFEEAALSKTYSEGETIPGYKVVMSGGKRVIADGDGAIEFLVSKGHPVEEVSVQKLRGIGELEALLGKKEFAELLEPYINKTEGKPSLVPESDKRPAVAPHSEAVKEFTEKQEDVL